MVTVTVNGKDYTGAVASDGSFGVNIPASDTQGLVDGYYVATAVVSDKAGNESIPDDEDFFVDDLTGTITINPISDGYINADEHNEPLVVSGTTTGIEPGQKVTVTLNNEDYTTTVKPDGTYELTIPANKVGELVDGNESITAKVQDKAGNEADAILEFVVDTNVGTISVDDISADGYINADEHNEPLVVTGKTTGIEAGQEVIVELNGKEYKSTIAIDGSYSVTVPASDIQALVDGTEYDVKVSSTDLAGNGVDTTKEVDVELANRDYNIR